MDFKTPRGRVHALRDINIQIPRGKSVGIVGESGSGKSTLIWTITQLLASNGIVEGGRALFNGLDLLKANQRQIRAIRGEDISIVFQDPMTSQSPVHSYEQQMRDILYRRYRMSNRAKRKRIIDMMLRVGIPDSEHRILQYPHQFSGGMRQRAGIAMALLMDPLLLIADEPTTALDVTMEAQITHLIRELHSEFSATIIVVSHNLGLIAELCDQVVVMYAGEVVEHGDVREIFYNASHPYTKALLDCDPARQKQKSRYLPVIPGDVPDLHSKPSGCVFQSGCSNVINVCRIRQPRAHPASNDRHIARCHMLDKSLETENFHKVSDGKPVPISDSGKKPFVRIGDLLLDVRNLCVRFKIMSTAKALIKGVKEPHIDAVIDASLSLRKGETLSIVGESGSGKTTLGRAILGLVKAHSGNAVFDGQNVLTLSQKNFMPLRRDMAMIFQDPVGSLSPRQTVRSLILEPFDIQGIRTDLEAEARRLCEMVRLPINFLSRYPHELSGGQARRVSVARALALNPKLIIADEPTAGLDVSIQGEILNLMNELQSEHGLGYLIISHNLPVVRHISDKLAIMYLGRLVERGDCEDIFSNPAHPYTEALVRGTPQPDPDKRRTLLAIEGEVPSLNDRPDGCEFHTRCKYASDRCRTERPSETALRDGRIVTCHYPLAV